LWQAGRPASVKWEARGSKPTKITIEMYPATDKSNVRVVSILGSDLSPDTTGVNFTLPDNIPAWQYAVRINDGSAFSYSPAFWVFDKDGKNVTDMSKEPEFPRAVSPAQCLGGVCSTDPSRNDPRFNKNGADALVGGFILSSLFAIGSLMLSS
jgi:hypothetical protein